MKIRHLIGIAILALLPLSVWAWGVVSISGGVAAPAGCSKGTTILSEDFESGFTNGSEWGGVDSWTEYSASTNIFTATSTALTGNMSGFIDNVGSGSTSNSLIYKTHTALAEASYDYATWRIRFSTSDATGNTGAGYYTLVRTYVGSTLDGQYIRAQFAIYNEHLWYRDNTTYQDCGALTDSTEYVLSWEMNLDAAGNTDCVRIWVNGTEITYADSRTGYNTEAQADPGGGISSIVFRSAGNYAGMGDLTIDDVIVYEGEYCATGD